MEFEKIKLRYKYLIEINKIDGNVIRVCGVLRRICDAIANIQEFSLRNLLSMDENISKECMEIISNLSDKRDKLEDILSY